MVPSSGLRSSTERRDPFGGSESVGIRRQGWRDVDAGEAVGCCGVPKLGARLEKSVICRQDASFGTPHVVAPTLRLSQAKRVRLLDRSALALDHVLYGAMARVWLATTGLAPRIPTKARLRKRKPFRAVERMNGMRTRALILLAAAAPFLLAGCGKGKY